MLLLRVVPPELAWNGLRVHEWVLHILDEDCAEGIRRCFIEELVDVGVVRENDNVWFDVCGSSSMLVRFKAHGR